jgi:hypothetical protein
MVVDLITTSHSEARLSLTLLKRKKVIDVIDTSHSQARLSLIEGKQVVDLKAASRSQANSDINATLRYTSMMAHSVVISKFLQTGIDTPGTLSQRSLTVQSACDSSSHSADRQPAN